MEALKAFVDLMFSFRLQPFLLLSSSLRSGLLSLALLPFPGAIVNLKQPSQRS